MRHNPPRGSVRLPAGVRIDGESLAGRFVGLDMLPVVADATDDAGRAALLDAIARRLDKATGRTKAARAERAVLERTADGIVRELTRRERKRRLPPKKTAKKATKKAAKKVAKKAPPKIREVTAVEWELVGQYNGSKPRGASRVDVSIRLRRADGTAMGEREAIATQREFTANVQRGAPNPIPTGYAMAGIDWTRPRWGGQWQQGSLQDYKNLLNPIQSMAAQGFRLGAVKEDMSEREQ